MIRWRFKDFVTTIKESKEEEFGVDILENMINTTVERMGLETTDIVIYSDCGKTEEFKVEIYRKPNNENRLTAMYIDNKENLIELWVL